MKLYEFVKFQDDEVTVKLHLQQIYTIEKALYLLAQRQDDDPSSLRLGEPTVETTGELIELFRRIYLAPRSSAPSTE